MQAITFTPVDLSQKCVSLVLLNPELCQKKKSLAY